MRYSIKWPQYAHWWDTMVIKPSRQAEFTNTARIILSHKDRYENIQRITGVPWALVGILHKRESDGNFDTYLGNGDSIHHQTTHVPRGRGPFSSFEEGAVDALMLDGLTHVQDWRLEKVLYYCEMFNGGGYDARGLPSPYVWGGTNIQRPGKYVADGKFNPRSWDTQPGTAPILKTLAGMDSTIQLVRET